MEFTSRHLRYRLTDVLHLGHTTTQHTTRHDKTRHGAQDTRDTVRRSQRFCSNGAVGSPVSALQLRVDCSLHNETFQKHTPNTKNKLTKQCPFWCIPYPFSRSTITTRSSPWRPDAVMGVILREEARYDVPKVPSASSESTHVTVCSLTSRMLFDIFTACQKSFVITKN